jgi:hypothetical protein
METSKTYSGTLTRPLTSLLEVGDVGRALV